MKTYKDFEKQVIGESDIAALVMVGGKEDKEAAYGIDCPVAEILKFGKDDAYDAYIIEGADVEIGAHYEKVTEFKSWLQIYDDTRKTFYKRADHIIVWRAGEMGCIIQFYND